MTAQRFSEIRRSTWIFILLTLAIALTWLIKVINKPDFLEGNVTVHKLHSTFLNDTRRIWVYLPPNFESISSPLPVLFMHDGQNVMDGNTSTHFGIEWRVDETLESYIQDKKAPPMIAVAIESNPDLREHEFLPVKAQAITGLSEGRAEDYAQMMIQELIPWLESNYNVSTNREDRIVAGSSFGGILSLYIATEHPDTFSSAWLFSPSLMWNNHWMQKRVTDLPEVLDISIWVDSGTFETDPGTFFEFRDRLVDKGWQEPKNLQAFLESAGSHDEASWARRFPMALSWYVSSSLVYGEWTEKGGNE